MRGEAAADIATDIVKLRQGPGNERQGMDLKAKSLKLKSLPRAYITVSFSISKH